MKVKIIKCSGKTYWYKDKIGKIFESSGHNGVGGYIVNTDSGFAFIKEYNCIELAHNYLIDIISPKSIHENAVEHGWYDTERTIPELLCLIHSEVSEALEAYRKEIPENTKGCIAEELADIVIRVFDMVEYLNIDIAKEVENKHNYNKTRPYRHGNKKI